MRTRQLLITAFISLGFTPSAFALDYSPDTIVASGMAHVSATPDNASVEIGVVTSNPVARVALAANNTEMTRVVAAIRAIGIADSALQTSNFAIEAEHPQTKNGETDISRTVGYQVTNKVTVTVSDLSKVAEIIDSAVKVGANSANSVSFGTKNSAALDDEALERAVRDARHNAELMATAEHAKVGRMISMTNVTGGRPFIPPPDIVINASAPMPVLPGESEVFSSVVVVFAIDRQ